MLPAAVILIAVLVPGCASGHLDVPATFDPGLARAVVDSTAPERPLHVVFDWVLRDGEARFTGSGVTRIEPPYRARLDLFGPRGEGYASAAVVDQELRLPPGVEEVPLPPPALMWAVLGVVAPPAGAVLEGTRITDEQTELHYAINDERLVYVLEGAELRSVEWRAERRLSVGLSGPTQLGIPQRATYRDWEGNTELMLNLESVAPGGPYSAEIWRPDA